MAVSVSLLPALVGAFVPTWAQASQELAGQEKPELEWVAELMALELRPRMAWASLASARPARASPPTLAARCCLDSLCPS